MVIVLDRINERHPEITEDDVRMAWENAFAYIPRENARPFEYMAVGVDSKGRLLELLGRRDGDDWIVWHAFTPPTKKALREIGIGR